MRVLQLFIISFCIFACSKSSDGSGGTNPPDPVDVTTPEDLEKFSPDSTPSEDVLDGAIKDAVFGLPDKGISNTLDGIDGNPPEDSNENTPIPELPLIGGGDPCDTNESPSIEIGEAGLYFEALASGADIPLTIGSEGGISVSFNLATRGVPQNVSALYTAVYLNETMLSDWTANNVEFTCQPDGSRLLIQYALNLPPDTDIFSLVDQPGTINIRLDFDGSSIETSHQGTFVLNL